MIHAYVIYCMLLNPTMCMNYEIVRMQTYEPASSPIACMMGGAIFSTYHEKMDVGGVIWVAKGGVRCISDPPREGDIQNWVEAEKARLERTSPQIR